MKFKRIIVTLLAIFSIFMLVSCNDEAPVNFAPVISGTQNYTVEVNDTLDLMLNVTASDEEDGDLTNLIEIQDELLDLTNPGTYEVTYVVRDSESKETKVTITIVVTAKAELSDLEKAQEDLDAYVVWFESNPNEVNFINRGEIHRSIVTWNSKSPYMSNEGVLLPLPYGMENQTASFTATFAFKNAKVTETFEVDLEPSKDVELTNERLIPFENTTTEYDVIDSNITLYFEEDGFVPYVKVSDFFELLKGFVDPEIEMSFVTENSILTIAYQYYSEDEDKIYDLILNIDATENTVTTNDPGFYWAYIYSTETNFGRHIEYDLDNPDAYYIDGSEVIYDLNRYNLDIVMHEDEVVLPYYVANQLFAGSSYYNLYYNNQKLYGIYGTPDSDSDEYNKMKSSNMNGKPFPKDLIIHNFNVLAFNLDYFYGLKDLLEIDTFYDLLYTSGTRFLSSDPVNFELTLRDLLLKKIDEPHTSLGYPGYFNDKSYDGAPQNSLNFYGSRFQSWYYDGYIDVDTEIGKKWGEAAGTGWNATSGKRPDYWFLDAEKNSVVITLNGYRTSDIDEDVSYNSSMIQKILELDSVDVLPEFTGSSKVFYYNNSDETNRVAELLIKGLDAEYLNTYKQLLLDFGYSLVKEETIVSSKKEGYYSITKNDKTYMVQLAYDSINSLFYIGVVDSIPATYASEWALDADIEELIDADSAVYMEVTFDLIMAESANVSNAMLDLTWNTGGNIGALYRVLGFITDEPFMTASISGDSNASSSGYVYIDGVPVYKNLNWALLTSPLSFSAANEMANIFKMNNLGTIIGLQTGGGASSITPILLPSGTSFTMSSNRVGAVRSGSGTESDPYVFSNTEYGITPDILIAIADIYDNETLLSAFNQG
jgi:hypothetical protein